MEYQLYWGDSHANIHPCHMAELDRCFTAARDHLDFFPVAYYPFTHDNVKGLLVETCGQRRQFLEEWERIKEAVAGFHVPGEFVTFPGYEWHGDRRRWGDHNVYYPGDKGELQASESLGDLFREVRKAGGIVIPHHTAYLVGERGKDWDLHDEELSPFVELYSGRHGSSESVDSPIPMVGNHDMGPRVSGGTVQDGLARGYHFGIIASNDSHAGFGGTWNEGLMAVYARELTREALWEAFRARRVYGVTGDRMQLDFRVNGHFMGEVLEASGPVEIVCRVKGAEALDRIELLRNNAVIHTRCYRDKEVTWAGRGTVTFKVRIETGWGPVAAQGFPPTSDKRWQMRLSVPRGRVLALEPCFTTFGQRIESVGGKQASWRHTIPVPRRVREHNPSQAVVVELEAPAQSEMVLEANGAVREFAVRDVLARTQVWTFYEDTKRTLRRVLALSLDEIENADFYYHNSHKIVVHKGAREAAYSAELHYVDEHPPAGENFYYVRASEINGQFAWSSPIWVRQQASG